MIFPAAILFAVTLTATPTFTSTPTPIVDIEQLRQENVQLKTENLLCVAKSVGETTKAYDKGYNEGQTKMRAKILCNLYKVYYDVDTKNSLVEMAISNSYLELIKEYKCNCKEFGVTIHKKLVYNK